MKGTATVSQRRSLMVAGGWLSALLACLQVDVGDRAAAERSRRAAFQLGREGGHPELMGWAFEIKAWIASVEGEFSGAAETARAGQSVTRVGGSVQVQLAVQEAKAWARLMDSRATEDALRRARSALAALPASSNPEHHFVFDETKLAFFAGTCYVWLGQDAIAENHAREVIRHSISVGRLTRVAEAHVDLGIIALRRGELEEACDHGRQAMGSKRLCATTLVRLTELQNALMEDHSQTPEVVDFNEKYILSCRMAPGPR
ncbi:MAG: hypothetical protein ACRD0K_00655 [Egibacteraceae bacterium]